MQVKRRRKKVPAFLKIFIAIVLMAGASLGTALAWQNAQDKLIAEEYENKSRQEEESKKEQSGENEEIVPESPYMASVSTSQIDVQKIKTASEAAKDVAAANPDVSGSSGDGQQEDAVYAREAAAGAVAKSAAVDYGYFADAIFFGDSISTGIPLYMKTMVPDIAVVAAQGVSPEGANTSKCIDVNGTRVTMLEAAKTKGERKKVYIMLGANALDLEETGFMKGYTTFVQSVKAMYPEAQIYVQSMLPVTASVNKTYTSKNINNERISAYNDSIRKMALEQGVYYVDAAQCMVDENGMLPIEASPYDGMHLTPEYYVKWFDYLRAHTVSAKQ